MSETFYILRDRWYPIKKSDVEYITITGPKNGETMTIHFVSKYKPKFSGIVQKEERYQYTIKNIREELDKDDCDIRDLMLKRSDDVNSTASEYAGMIFGTKLSTKMYTGISLPKVNTPYQREKGGDFFTGESPLWSMKFILSPGALLCILLLCAEMSLLSGSSGIPVITITTIIYNILS